MMGTVLGLLARFSIPAPLSWIGQAISALWQSLWDALVTTLSHPSVFLLLSLMFAAGWWQGTTKGARQLEAYIAKQEAALNVANAQVNTLNARVEAMAAASDARRAATSARAIKGVPNLPQCVAQCGLSAEAIAHLNALK